MRVKTAWNSVTSLSPREGLPWNDEHQRPLHTWVPPSPKEIYVICRLGGTYSEKLWPRSWKCCPRHFQDLGHSFSLYRPPRPANNIYDMRAVSLFLNNPRERTQNKNWEEFWAFRIGKKKRLFCSQVQTDQGSLRAWGFYEYIPTCLRIKFKANLFLCFHIATDRLVRSWVLPV